MITSGGLADKAVAAAASSRVRSKISCFATKFILLQRYILLKGVK